MNFFDYEWAAIKPLLSNEPRGVPSVDDRRVLNGTLRSGAPWRDLPDSFGPYTTCNQIKQCRRIVTHYDNLAANYLAFIQLASIRLWLRVNESATHDPARPRPPSLSHPETARAVLGLAAAARGAALAAGAVRVEYKKAPDLAARSALCDQIRGMSKSHKLGRKPSQNK